MISATRRSCPTRSIAWALGFTLAILAAYVSAQTSELWGEQGELWDPAGRLPDFSYAGYRSASFPIPSPAAVANVMNFGAVGDGFADDTDAFEAAITAANNGAVLIPAGRFKITRVLYINKSNLVLRGAGQGLTTLVFTKHLTELLGPPPGTAGLESWSWSGGLIWVNGTETNNKLADVTTDTNRGSNTLSVSSTAGLSVGQTIRLTMTDPDGSLGRHINAEQFDAHPTLVGRRLVRFPTKIAAINGNEITLERPLRLDVRTSWSPEIRSLTGQLEEVGLEGFTMEFPTGTYPGHFNELGFNGIWMDGVAHSWIRNVTIHNCENGIMLERSLFNTVDNVSLTADTANRRVAGSTYYTGHHGIQLRRTDDCLVANFSIPTRFYHDLTVEDTTGSVFMKGSGVDINFDHHTYLPYENLFTQINIGVGSRHFASSGSRNPEAAARETLWNISSTNPVTTLPNPSPSRGLWPQANFIGINTTLATTKDPINAWIEAITPTSLTPPNLYEAQLTRRITPPAVVSRTLQWDGAGIGTSGGQGGSGTWDSNLTSNWWNGSANEIWPTAGGTDDQAVFSGAAGTVTISGTGVVASNLTFNTAAYTVTGGTLLMNGNSPTITANHGGNTTNIGSVIAGSSGITKSGPSTVQLRGANRYSGDTHVKQGTLLIGAANNRLPTTTRLILGDGSTNAVFQMNSRSQEVGGLITMGNGSTNRIINSSASATTFTVNIDNAADTDIFNGILGGGGTNDNNYQFAKSGPGRLVISGDCTHTGLTTINSGTLQFGNDGPTGKPGPGTIVNNGTLRFDRSGTLNLTNEIRGSGGLHVDCPTGNGTIELRAANTYAGNIEIDSGTLDIQSASALGSGAKSINITTGLGTLQLNGAIAIPSDIAINISGEPMPGRIHNLAGTNTITGPLNLSLGAGNSMITSSAGSLEIAGNITAPDASRTLKLAGNSTDENLVSGIITELPGKTISLEKSGTGTWALSNSNTHTGSTLVTSGTLNVRHNSALGTTTSGTTINTGAKLQLQGPSLNIPENLTLGTGSTGATVENLSGTNTLSGTITRNGSLTLLSTSGKLTVLGNIGDTNNTLNLQGDGDGEISGNITTAFGLNKSGTGTWTLSGFNSFTNSSTVNSGRLILSGSLDGPLTVFNGILAPQGTPSTTSSLNLQPGALLEVRPGDTFTVGSTVTLAGNLTITAPPGLTEGTSYTILNKSSAGLMSGSFSGKPEGTVFPSGGYNWLITYKGGNGNDLVITIQPETAIEQWRLLHYGTIENAGNAADNFDSNNDGENNLIEFATGQSPHTATFAVTSAHRTATDLEFTYQRNRAAVDDGYSFSIESTTSLSGSWNDSGPGSLISDGPLQTLKATIPADSDEKRFARLKVSTP